MTDRPDKQLGKYKIETLLGRGGMGAVYKAFQPGLERNVAIKTIHSYLMRDPNAVKRFEREAKIVAGLRHPSIVQVHDFDVEDDVFYMVMEFVPGETLESRLQALQAKGERLPLAEALHLFQAITRAVAYAHAQGITHQDLKPANVLLTEQGQPVLADFGLSRIVDAERLDTPGSVSGTPQYMSPEQCAGELGDMRSDVYSLGVMLYQLTTGALPFSGKSAVALILKHISETPPPPRLLNPDLPAAIEEVIHKTLAKNPANRYPSAQELLAAVEDIVAPAALFGEELAPPTDSRCPYRGLQAFEEEHAEFYFGREALIGRLSEKLKQTLTATAAGETQTSRFLAVLGASGSGKSSLVQAGLIPALRLGVLPGSDRWVIRVMKPGSRPLEELAWQLAAILGGEERSEAKNRLFKQLTVDGRTLHLLTRMAWWRTAPECRLLLVIDQFEELFTLCRNEAERESFIENLLYAAAVNTGRVIVLLTMRADFYHRCAAHRDLANRISAQQLLVGPMNEAELRRAIEQPALRVGLRFEAGLINAILADVADQPGALPLLQHALLELWENRYGPLLLLRAYQTSGGVSGAIARRADMLYQSFSPAEQTIVRQVMLRLTQPGEGTEDTRRRARRSELLLGAGRAGPDDSHLHAQTVERVLQRLTDARLITTSRDADTGWEYVDVAHEALIRGWTRLRQWIDRDRESLRTHRRLTEAAAEWERFDHDASYLYRGARLAEAEEWGQAHSGELNVLEQQFLQASVQLRDQELLALEARRQRELEQAQALAKAERRRAEEQARATRRLRRLALALAVVFLLALAAAILAWTQQQRAGVNEQLAREQAAVALAAEQVAETRRLEAETAQAEAVAAKNEAEQSARQARAGQLAAQAQTAALEHYPQRSLLLAAEALNINLQAGAPPLPSAENALRQNLADSGGRSLIGQDDLLTTMAISPDHRWLVTASGAIARLWSLPPVSSSPRATGAPFILSGHRSPLTTIAFSPAPLAGDTGKRWLATGDESGVVRLWDVSAQFTTENTSETELTIPSLDLAGHNAAITAIVFSPDQRWLVTGSADTTVRLWDLSTLLDSGLPLTDVSAAEGLAAIPSITLSDHQSPITTLAISSASPEAYTDHHWLVTGDESGVAYLWNVSAILRAGLAAAGAFSAENLIAPSAILSGHQAAITAIVISPDRRWLATGSDDATARLWSFSALLEPDQNRNQDAPETSPPSIVLPNQSFVTVMAASPDGRWLAIGSWDNTARLWDAPALLELGLSRDRGAAGSAVAPVVLRGHDEPVLAVGFSPDNHWLVTGSSDHTARLWDLTAPDPAATSIILRGHEAGIVAVSINVTSENASDSSWLITGSSDATARQWDLGQAPDSIAATPLVLRSPANASLTAVAASPDNRWLVMAATGNNTLSLWNMPAVVGVDIPDSSHEDPAPIVLGGPEATVTAVAISDVANDSHRRWLVAGDESGAVSLWNLSVPAAAEPIVLPGHTAAVTTIAISPDNGWLVSGSDDTTIRLWNLRSGSASATPLVLSGHEGAITALAVSPNSRWLVSGSGDNTGRLWNVVSLLDADTSDPADSSILLRSHEGAISDIVISPNSRWLVTASSDHTARLWNVDFTAAGIKTVAAPLILQGHEDKVLALAISPDSRWLATGSSDHTARLWNLPDVVGTASPGRVITNSLVLPGHDKPVLAVAIGPEKGEGNYWLITAGGDGVARVWDLPDALTSTAIPVVLTGHTRPVFAAAIRSVLSGDGVSKPWVITAGNDNTVRFWPLPPEDLLELACDTAGRNFTQAEWAQYFPGQAYRKTCVDLPAHRSAIGAAFDRANALLQTGDRRGALAAYSRVVDWAGETQDVYLNSLICWQGSLEGLAEIVLPACEYAVQLAPTDGALRDNRGLAYALTGSYPDAIADFKYFVTWSKETGLYQPYGRRREAWIIELEAGRNPFNADLLESLRTE
ncbi:MAG: protein kinase [Anaerolineae bacterium]|nr:protein kinase [Anaerolineae bacterium]